MLLLKIVLATSLLVLNLSTSHVECKPFSELTKTESESNTFSYIFERLFSGTESSRSSGDRNSQGSRVHLFAALASTCKFLSPKPRLVSVPENRRSKMEEHVADSGRPNSKITYSTSQQADQQENTDKNEISIIDDCDFVPPTMVLNPLDLIVDQRYAYFHHDNEDVQEHSSSFLNENNLEPTTLCTEIGCNDIET